MIMLPLIYPRLVVLSTEDGNLLGKPTCGSPMLPQILMLKNVLIANRGEIAVPLLYASRELDIRTVVVFSTADADSLLTHIADEGSLIGTPFAIQTYLNPVKILDRDGQVRPETFHPRGAFTWERSDTSWSCV